MQAYEVPVCPLFSAWFTPLIHPNRERGILSLLHGNHGVAPAQVWTDEPTVRSEHWPVHDSGGISA
jgi:hypothetical protein